MNCEYKGTPVNGISQKSPKKITNNCHQNQNREQTIDHITAVLLSKPVKVLMPLASTIWTISLTKSLDVNFAGIGDINTKDESYEYLFDRSPAVPQPLLATAWELDNVALIDALMDFKPDTSVPYFNQYNRAAKPLFFQVSYLSRSKKLNFPFLKLTLNFVNFLNFSITLSGHQNNI